MHVWEEKSILASQWLKKELWLYPASKDSHKQRCLTNMTHSTRGLFILEAVFPLMQAKINKIPKSFASRWTAIHMCKFTVFARASVLRSPLACAKLSGQVGTTQSCRKDLDLKVHCLYKKKIKKIIPEHPHRSSELKTGWTRRDVVCFLLRRYLKD